MTYFFVSSTRWSPTEAPDVVAQMAQKIPELDFGHELEVKSLELSFYDDFKLFLFKDPSWVPENLFIYALSDGETVYWLNGSSPPIHELNANGVLELSEKTALDYLEFFCFFVRGEEGPFYIINSLKAPYLPDIFRADPGEHQEVRDLFEQRYQSPRAFGTTTDGSYRFSALVYYSNAIFAADFKIPSSGIIEMEGDEPLMADLPRKLECPITL